MQSTTLKNDCERIEKNLVEMKLPNAGNKAILVDPLVQATQNHDASPIPNITHVPTTPSSPWELLQPNARFTDPNRNNQNDKVSHEIEFGRREFKLTYQHYERTGCIRMLKN